MLATIDPLAFRVKVRSVFKAKNFFTAESPVVVLLRCLLELTQRSSSTSDTPLQSGLDYGLLLLQLDTPSIYHFQLTSWRIFLTSMLLISKLQRWRRIDNWSIFESFTAGHLIFGGKLV